MTVTVEKINAELSRLVLPDGGTLISRDMVRAVAIDGANVRFVIEAPSTEIARQMEPLRAAAQKIVGEIAGVDNVSVALTAHSDNGPKSPSSPPPNLKIGGHPKPQAGPTKPAGIKRILAVGSGKGGVGKSTVSSNLAVALAKQGRRVGLLDADIYGPSQPRMMGVNKAPKAVGEDMMLPLEAHGVKMISIGLMLDPDQAVIWRGPMLMGALQQLLGNVQWGTLDVLIIDLPPGTGDVQLSLCQKTELTGAIIVSTPQDVALIDARKALDMFNKLDTPVLGMIENMSTYVCPECGHEAHLFGHGGVMDEAEKIGIPFLGGLPIDLETRLAGDAGTPIAIGDGAMAKAYGAIAAQLVKRDLA